MRNINEIIIHCSATPDGKDFNASDIDRWHKERGFTGIGYHFVVLRNGTVEKGRPLEYDGAHVRTRNEGTIGICYIGGLTADKKTARDTRTPEQKKALIALCKNLLGRYPAIRKISGHNEYAAKACPSFNVRNDPLGKLVK